MQMRMKAVSMLLVLVFMFSVVHITGFETPVVEDSKGEWSFDSPEVDFAPKWSFDWPKAWSEFAYIDNDSAQLVIGLSDIQPNSYAKLKNLIAEKRGKLVNTVSIGEHRAVLADVPFEAVSSFAAETKNAGLSRYVEPNFKFQATLVPNDPYWDVQWGPKKIEADWAWNTTTGNRSILVAVIDSGIDYNHPDLVANYVPLGYDWVNNDNDTMDDFFHGTHCAGIIAAELNNSEGIAGLAQVQIMAEKVLNRYGGGYATDVSQGITHAVNQSANILSLSLGSYMKSELIQDAVKYAYNAGVLVVAAAGNDACTSKLYPAAYDEVIAVTATDESDDPSSWPKGKGTNYGDWVEIAAPGTNIYSTISKIQELGFTYPYDDCNGTSMACPHVAGVAALIWSRFPNLTRDQVQAQLRYGTDDLGDSGFDVYYGYGRLNARIAVEQAPTDHDLLIWNWGLPPALEPGDVAMVNTTVFNFGKMNEENMTVQLLVNGSLVNSTHISFLASNDMATVNCSWIPTDEGIYNVTSYVVPVSGENVTRYNARSRYVRVKVGKFFVVPTDYSTIQEAIDSASPGYTINVSSGTYYELLNIDKSLKLIGKNKSTTILDGHGEWTPNGVVYVASYTQKVEISGFTIQNTTGPGDVSCIYLGPGSSGINIAGNIFTNASLGICSDGSSGVKITDNEFTSISRYGIYIQRISLGGYNHDISNNTITMRTTTEYSYGIVGAGFPDVACYNTISGNIVTNARDGGIAIVGFGHNTISGNTLNSNVIAICVWNSRYNTIRDNKATNNDAGIWIRWADHNTIKGNKIKNNTHGLGLEHFEPYDVPKSNVIYHNNFLNNTVQLYRTYTANLESNIWVGWGTEGNYWSDYDGTDNDGDGIGDTYLPWKGVDWYPLMYPWRAIVRVPQDHPTMQEAINATYSEATILVASGTYCEHVTVYRSLTLTGESLTTTIIDGNGTGNVVTVQANNVHISQFTMQNGYTGIQLESNGTTVSGNKVRNNDIGIKLNYCEGNTIYHNSFINNAKHADAPTYYTNTWDDGYPSGGNYWSDYNGTDLYSGPYQNETGSDGIGDTPYVIDANNQDNYPLIRPWGSIQNVDTGLIYLTIQKAIDAPETLDGHTIEVEAGTYYENVVVGKSLTLIGEDPSTTVIDGSGTGNVVAVQANEVRISQFTITNGSAGIHLEHSYANTIIENTLTNNSYGVYLDSSKNNTISDNIVNSNEQKGISLLNNSTENYVSGNLISSNGWGIYLEYSDNNNIIGNKMSINTVGIRSKFSKNNAIHHNFLNNTESQATSTKSVNTWDDGYPSGGNYWSDYTDVDQYSGPYQNETGGDGIWDHPYILDAYNKDNYPLMQPWKLIKNINTGLTYSTIQEAIDAASLFNTIKVYVGTHYEHVVVSKTLILLEGIHPNTAIIDGSGTGNVVTVQADNVYIRQFTIQNGECGIFLYSSGNKVSDNTISNNSYTGILVGGDNNILRDNLLSDNYYGIYLESSSDNMVSGNTLSYSTCGVYLKSSNMSTVSGNEISNNDYGIYLDASSGNFIYYNNFINNTEQLNLIESPQNVWDDGEGRGNYWSDYTGTDTDGDGIGDTNLPWQGVDYYPLMNPVIRVPQDYPTIQAAINAANDDTLILVASGTYYEHVVVDKPLMLIGEDPSTTIIDGGGTGYVVAVQADNVYISRFTIQNGSYGVSIDSTYNTVSGNIISNNVYGFSLASYNSISNNTITNNHYGFYLIDSDTNSISNNTISNNDYGVYLGFWSDYNTVSGNIISNNDEGVYLNYTKNNAIYHNNFIDNTVHQAYVDPNNPSQNNAWDDGYPSGGNYWSDYTGVDNYSGPNQNETGSDGIGDTPYNIPGREGNQDNYPLMHPWGSIRNVDTGLIYLTIQKAIDAPETLDGHTIEVEAGTYYENVVVGKSLTIMGEDPSTTVIDGSGTGNVVTVQADNSTISRFTIQNGECGILLGSNNNSIKDNTITNNGEDGIALNGDYNTIVENNIRYNGEGIYLSSSSDNNVIHHNNFINNTVQVCSIGLNNTWIATNHVGNYWSDYNGTDENPDYGIGDTPYVIDEDDQDDYPLMWKWFPGDLDGDGDVDGSDFVNFGGSYPSQMGDPYYNPIADLDYDGDQDSDDFDIFLQNYGKHDC